MDSVWKKIWSFDRPQKNGGGKYMMIFIGESIFFILSLCGDYHEATFMADFNVIMTMSLLSLYMSCFVVVEGEHYRLVYNKIMYFPIDRKKYLFAKAVPAAAVIGFQIGITWLSFLCKILMKQGIGMETMLLITLCMAVCGIWYFLCLLGIMVLGERAVSLFPIPFILGVVGVHMVCFAAA